MSRQVQLEEFHRTVFDVLDTDGDGYLGSHQVREALIAFEMKVTIEEYDQALSTLGLRDEYAFELNNIIDIINRVYQDRYEALIAKVHSVFDSHINKKKKKLPTEEITSYIEEIITSEEGFDGVDDMVAKADPNETGFIDYAAFESIVLTLKEKLGKNK